MIKRLIIFLKGLAMGAADVVPGVSGGTIAFITGIYDELLASINAVNLDTLRILRKQGFAAAWKEVNGNFLLPLLLGIGTSILSFAQLFKHLLETHPVSLWAFFFGLIMASVWLVGKMINTWNVISVAGLVSGTLIAFWLSVVHPGDFSQSLWFLFVAGAIAICAMILPGISGSFVLLLLGAYETVLTALNDRNLLIIAVFASGCIVGLLSFSRLLQWTLRNFYEVTLSVLTGFLVGSLYKIWPWKLTIQTRINSHGEEVPFIQENCWPSEYLGNQEILPALISAIAGIVIILVLSRFKPAETQA